MSERSVSKQTQEKRWYTVMAPEIFDRAELGETPADEPEQVYDRTIETTLGDLRDDPSENNTKLTFQVTDVGSDAAYTEFVQHELTRDYLRSLTRRGTSKVDAFLTVLTTDDYRLEVQPVAYTTKNADRSQERAVRETMVELVEEAAAERTLTIYPLRRVEVQKTRLSARPEEVAAQEEAAVDVEE
ncbi:30S ribosomal protein S3ae [Halobacteriales archaeon QS_1_69_70]|nr:MAG: 30S ribosomal protein S3ae [Halobacteriales archaeon QS_1_69_70]